MPAVITTDSMPRTRHTGQEPAGPESGPDLSWLHGRTPAGHELDVREEALRQQREREKSIVSMGR